MREGRAADKALKLLEANSERQGPLLDHLHTVVSACHKVKLPDKAWRSLQSMQHKARNAAFTCNAANCACQLCKQLDKAQVLLRSQFLSAEPSVFPRRQAA